jgi:AcrR family transcriptional regulator
MTSPTSLRERSKAKRRAAIQRSAMRLFAERGYEGTTIADIADDAEVAPRTVTLYFSSKLELALSTTSDMTARLTEILEADPGISFTDAIDRWSKAEATTADPELTAATSAMFEANPTLARLSSGRVTEAAGVVFSALFAEMAIDRDSPMAAIASAAASAALAAYLTVGLSPGADPGLHDDFMRYLRAIVAGARPV